MWTIACRPYLLYSVKGVLAKDAAISQIVYQRLQRWPPDEIIPPETNGTAGYATNSRRKMAVNRSRLR